MVAPVNKNRKVSVPLRWAARGVFGAAVLVLGLLIWRQARERPSAPAPIVSNAPAIHIDWTREPFTEWKGEDPDVILQYPLRYEAVRGFGRFTSRDMAQGMKETDVVAFRSAAPRSVITIAAYKAPRALSWPEWTALARLEQRDGKGAPTLAEEFGGSERVYKEIRQGDRPALAVSARGGVRYPVRGSEAWELWKFESQFVAEGDRAVRVTAGVHVDQYAAALPGFRKVLESFRWLSR